MKARRRHAKLVVRQYAELNKVVCPPQLCVQPHKGKPCAMLLGRATQQLWTPWRLSVGDIFTIGHSHVRVVHCTRMVGGAAADWEAADGAPPAAYTLVEDTGRRYRRKEKKTKRRERKLTGGDSSSDSDDDGKREGEGGSDGERYRGMVTAPTMKLELVAGPWRGRSVEFGAEGATLGSSQRCTLPLAADLNVSSLHARISHVGGNWQLADCSSGSGTFLLVADLGAPISTGALVRIGRTEISFYMKLAEGDPSVQQASVQQASVQQASE